MLFASTGLPKSPGILSDGIIPHLSDEDQTGTNHIYSSGEFDLALDTNLMAHREAIQCGVGIMRKTIEARQQDGRPIRVLDLACGKPTTAFSIISGFPRTTFEYVGIDVNPHQAEVAKASASIPSNLIGAQVLLGNAWEIEDHSFSGKFDFVLSGLNFHHGTPEEIYYVLLSLKNYLEPQGHIMIHDFFRPEGFPYLRRPKTSPLDGSLLLDIVDPNHLRIKNVPQLQIPGTQEFSMDADDWRVHYLEALIGYLVARGFKRDKFQILLDRIYERDFPLTIVEMRKLIELAGFVSRIHRFEPIDHPLRQFYSVIEATV